MKGTAAKAPASASLRPGRKPSGAAAPAPRGRRLVNVLVLATALPLTLLSVGTGALSWWNGQRSAETLADALGNSISEQVRLQLDQLLNAPPQINALNGRAIAEGRLDPGNLSQLASTFISQMEVFPVGYINYGSQDGDYVGIERLDSGALRLNLMERRRGASRQFVYAIGPKGPASQPEKVYEQMEAATQEAWYAETAQAGRPIWSSVYQWDDKPDVLSVSYNEPVRYPDGRLRGVIGVDFILTQLNARLAHIRGQRPGQVLITERNGLLVASSSGNTIITSPGKPPQRRRIIQSANPIEREAGQLLFRSGGAELRVRDDLVRRSTSQALNEQLSTRNAFVEVLPWNDRHGLDWLVLVILPRESLTGRIQEQTLQTTLLGLLTLAVLLLTTTRSTSWILRPLQQLSDTAQQLGHALRRSPGQPLMFQPELARGSASEIVTLSAAMGQLITNFNGLVAALRRSGNRLQREVEQKARALDQAIRNEQEARDASQARERFLGHLGEEMLPPLAALRGNAHQARAATESQNLHRRLEAIESSARQLEQLAHNLRSYASLGAGQWELRPNPFDPARLLADTVEPLRPLAEGKGLRLGWAVAAGTPGRLLGDGERLRQVLDHLLANAIRFSGNGEVMVQARLQQEGPEPELVLQVRDTGIGMDPQQVARLLGEQGTMPTPPPIGHAGGAGLGLALCRRLMLLMEGEMEISSRPGEGTTITLTVPCEPGDGGSAMAATPERPA
jgi:signal transduction histidine kinase